MADRDDWSIPATLKYPPTAGPSAEWWEKRSEWYQRTAEQLRAENAALRAERDRLQAALARVRALGQDLVHLVQPEDGSYAYKGEVLVRWAAVLAALDAPEAP